MKRRGLHGYGGRCREPREREFNTDSQLPIVDLGRTTER